MSENSPDLEDDTGTYESGLPGFLGTIDEIIAKVDPQSLKSLESPPRSNPNHRNH